jgi:hypothetical protein
LKACEVKVTKAFNNTPKMLKYLILIIFDPYVKAALFSVGVVDSILASLWELKATHSSDSTYAEVFRVQ